MGELEDWWYEPWKCTECGARNTDLLPCDNCGNVSSRQLEVLDENVDEEAFEQKVQEGERVLYAAFALFVVALVLANVVSYL